MNPEDRRNLGFMTTLLMGLLVTGYLSYTIYALEQERTRRALISSATHIDEILEARLQRLAALPGLLEVLPDDAVDELHALLPFVAVSTATQDPAGGEFPATPGVRSGPVQTGLDAEGRATALVELFIRAENQRRRASVDLRQMLAEPLSCLAGEHLLVVLHDLRPGAQDPFYQQDLSGVAVARESTLPGWLRDAEYRSSVTFLDQDWLLQIRPLASFADRHTTFMPLVLFTCGCLLSLLLALLVHQRYR